jgi:hypothetical protein
MGLGQVRGGRARAQARDGPPDNPASYGVTSPRHLRRRVTTPPPTPWCHDASEDARSQPGEGRLDGLAPREQVEGRACRGVHVQNLGEHDSHVRS